MAFFAWLGNLLTGGLLDKVLGHLRQRDAARLDAMNSSERQAYQDRQDERAARKDVRLATAGFWEMRLLTFLIAFPFVAHLWSVWADTQFKFGWAVDKFPPPFDEWEGAILLSFFGITAVGGGIRAIAGAIALKHR